jgi:precorrin-6B methylase 2
MIPFSASSPFPLMVEAEVYAEAQEHSVDVDRWLGLEVEKVEKALESWGCQDPAPNSTGDQNLWIGLASKSLLTPYSEIRGILSRLSPQDGDTVVDLGAGYGRMAFVMARHYPLVRYVGYEYVGERVKEGLRCIRKTGARNVELLHADLASPNFKPLSAQFYFIYDYGAPKSIEKTLHDLRRIAAVDRITVVGRGRSSRDLIEKNHPWLSQIVPPTHEKNFSIYKSRC